MGISADLMDSSCSNMEDHVFRSSFEKSVIESTDILIKTPGTPNNWEELNDFQYSSPGLAEISFNDKKTKSGTLSLQKILALKKYLIDNNIFPDYIESNIVIYPSDPHIPPISIKNNPLPVNTPEIVVVNRTVLCDFQYMTCILQINSADDNKSSFKEICSHREHQSRNSTDEIWTCKNFNINSSDLSSRDYYLITDTTIKNEKTSWVLDKTDYELDHDIKFSDSVVKLNEKLGILLNNTNQTVLWLHIKSNPAARVNTYIVSTPKNTPANTIKYYYITPKPCYFIVTAWIK